MTNIQGNEQIESSILALGAAYASMIVSVILWLM
jgi:hypothetical protein